MLSQSPLTDEEICGWEMSPQSAQLGSDRARVRTQDSKSFLTPTSFFFNGRRFNHPSCDKFFLPGFLKTLEPQVHGRY